jgi:choline dehydrogenase-like flavoprotein
MEEQYPVLKRDYPLNEKNLAYWVNDKESPYTEAKRFDWYRGYQVGGRSLMWGRQSYRLSDYDFEANAKEGIAVDWPMRYEELAPWYSHVERHAGIAGSAEGLPQLPDGQFQPAMPLNCAEELVAGRLRGQYEGRRRIIPGRTANITQALPGRNAVPVPQRLLARLPVRRLLQHAVVHAAGGDEDGAPTLRPFAIATEVLYDKEPQARHRRARARRDHRPDHRLHGEGGLLSAPRRSTRPGLLMRSATDVWPDGLGSSSGELGHNVMDHHFRCGAEGTLDEAAVSDRSEYGRRPTGFYIPRYRNLFGDKRDYLRGFGYQGSAGREGWSRAVAELGVGGAFKDEMASPRRVEGGRHGVRRDAAESTTTASRSTSRAATVGACRCCAWTWPPARTSG